MRYHYVYVFGPTYKRSQETFPTIEKTVEAAQKRFGMWAGPTAEPWGIQTIDGKWIDRNHHLSN